MKVLVTGGAGFIGSNLVRQLLSMGHEVCVIDNLSSGYAKHLENLSIEFLNFDLADTAVVEQQIFKGCSAVFHLAANVDNRFSWENPFLSIDSNIRATMNVGLACKKWAISKIVYSSTGTIYGDCQNPPFKEHEENSAQTSLYGATKYSAEGILSCFSVHFGIDVLALRFVGVLGERISHGHIYDFLRNLRLNPQELEVLGNGQQRKAYMYVGDLVNAIAHLEIPPGFSSLNIGRTDYSLVTDSIEWIKEELNLEFNVKFGQSARGWIGDNPFLTLDVTKIEELGWAPKTSIETAAKKAIRWLWENHWIFDES